MCYGEINGADVCEHKDKAESQEKRIKTCISKPYNDRCIFFLHAALFSV